MPKIHPTATVDPAAQLAENVEIGPHAFVDANVAIGEGTVVMHGAHIGRGTTLGRGNRIFPGAVIGQVPQDIGFQGEDSFTIIGDNNTMREGFTVNRGHRLNTVTRIGSNNYFMINSHIAHDCQIGDFNIFANGALIAGHVEVGNRAILSGNVLVHQFVRIGSFALMRGGARISKDLPPFCICDGGNWARAINVIGLRRNNYDAARIRAIKEAFKAIFRSGMRLSVALDHVQNHLQATEDVQKLVDFIRASKRGIVKGRNTLEVEND
ncbi:MAG: acyl-ACP--UDP-N-acetylglucosamine O-acyltransferase [Desulfuromonadaceae bacterium]|nr:acyl-ACP--UDP-N-acetylglucosamine O-acyltransferase [Desulfuromonadaceae bacterium]